MKIIKLDIVDVKCNKFYHVKFFDNGPGFRNMRGFRKMGFLGRFQEFFANISETIQPILVKRGPSEKE